MPKSDSFTWPSAVTRMLEGFTSRCTMPAAWAAASASAAWRSSGAASSGVSAPSRRTSSASVTPLDVLHHQPVVVALLDEVEDGDDVRVVEARREPGLPLGPLEVGGPDAGRQAQPLQRHLPAEHLVGAEPDRAHATATDLAVERCTCLRSPWAPFRTAASLLIRVGTRLTHTAGWRPDPPKGPA